MTVNYSAPDGRLILKADADRTEWLRVRTTGVGGTDVATIAGANKYQTPFDAWSDKVEPRTEEISSEAMWWGSQTEALTRARFQAITGLFVRKVGTYANKDALHHIVNPDGFVSDGGVIEIKDHERLSEAGKCVLSGQITDHAYTQLQWAMHVTGRSHGWFAAKVGKQTVVLGPFPRDEQYIARLVVLADVFWKQVTTRTPPPMDIATVTADEVAARFPVVESADAVEVTDLPIPDLYLEDLSRLAEIRDLGSKYSEEREQIEARLKALIGDHEYLTVSGRPVFRWQQVAGRKAFDKDTAIGRLAELTGKTPVEIEAELTKQSAPTRRFSPIATKEAA